MGTLTLRTALGIATLACAVGAQAQLNPAVRQATGPLVQPIKTQRNWTHVELRDRAGNVVILSYTDGRDGARLIKFVDGEGRLIMGLPARAGHGPIVDRGDAESARRRSIAAVGRT